MIDAERSVEIAASPATVYAVLADVERYPEWQPAVTGARPRERDEHGRVAVVESRLDAGIRELHLVLRYAYVTDERVSWSMVEGDVRDVHGAFEVSQRAGGVSAVTYRLSVDPGRRLGLLLRGPVLDRVRAKIVDGTLEQLGRRVGES